MHKIRKKIISCSIVLILLLTVVSATVSSRSTLSEKLSDFKEKIENVKSRETPIIDSIRDSNFKEKIENVKEKISNILYILKNPGENSGIGSLKSSSSNNLLRSLGSYIALKESSSLLSFYTNYAGNEKTTDLRLGMSKSIDVDDDGDKDIRVSYKIYPFIERPLIFTFNVKLNIDRLIGFEDENEYFEAYLQLHFLGLLDANNTNDKVKFGYASEEGYEVPKDFSVTYKYLPYFLYKEKPKHKISYNPGLIANDDILGLIFGYDDFNIEDETYESRGKWTTFLDPVVKTNLVFGRADEYFGRQFILETSKETKATIKYDRIANGSEFSAGLVIDKLTGFNFEMELTPFKEGGGRIEYIQNGSEDTDVTMFFEKNNSMYVYLEDIPPHMKLSWLPEKEGNMEFTTFNEGIKRVGIRDTPPGLPLFRTHAYLEDLPSQINFNWNMELEEGGEIDVFCQQAGVSAHIISNDFLGSGTKVEAHFQTNTNLNFSVFWDKTKNSFGIMRTNSDLQVDLHVLGVNGSSFDFSANIKNNIVGPFEIILDQLFDGKAEIEFTSNIVEINNLDARLYLVDTGTFIAKMTYLRFNDSQSGINFKYYYEELSNGFEFGYELDVYNGVEIRGLILGYNEFLLPIPDINVGGSFHQANSVRVTIAELNYFISEDQSYGYIELSGALSITTDNVLMNAVGDIVGSLKGTVLFATEKGILNISWETVNGETQLSVDGSGIASLSGFELIVGDKIEFRITSLIGKFTINSHRNSGYVNIWLDDAFSALDLDFGIAIEDFNEVSMKCNIDLDFEVGLSGYVGFGWSNGELSYVNGLGDFSYQGKLGIYGLEFSYGGSDDPKEKSGMSIKANSIELIGGLDVDFKITYQQELGLTINFVSENGIRLEISGLRVNIPDFPSIKVSGISLYGKGKMSFDLESLIIDFDAEAKLGVSGIIVSKKGEDAESSLYVRCNSVSIAVSGKITIDLNKTKVSFDVKGRFGIDNFHMTRPQVLKITFFVSAQAKATISYNATQQKVKIFVDMTRTLKIGGLHLYVTGDILNNSWIGIDLDKLIVDLRDDAEATIFLDGSGLKFYANIDYVEIKNLKLRFKNKKDVDETYFRIEGIFDFKFGENSNSYFWIIVDTLNPYPSMNPTVRMKLHNGDLTVSNFKLGVDIGTKSRVDLEFDYLMMTADFEFELYALEESMHIFAQGTGNIYLSDMNFSADLDIGGKSICAVLDNFELGFDKVSGSLINLEFGKESEEWTFKGIHSASIGGSVSKINIQGLYITTDHIVIWNEDPESGEVFPAHELEIKNLNMDFVGSGSFYAYLTQPDANGVQNIEFEAKIPGEGQIYIDYLFLNAAWTLVLELENFRIFGPTTFHLEGTGVLFNKGAGLEKTTTLDNIELTAGCTSQWSADMLFIYYAVGFRGFRGEGDISAGVQLNNAPNAYGGGDFIVKANGGYSWTDLELAPFYAYNETTNQPEKIPGIPTGPGSLDGNIELRIDLGTFLGLLVSSFPIPNEGKVEVIAYESTHIDVWRIYTKEGIDTKLELASIQMQPGSLSIIYNFSDGMSVSIISTTDVSVGLIELPHGPNGKFAICIGEFQIKPGDFSISFQQLDAEHNRLYIESKDLDDSSIGLISIRNLETGKELTIGSLQLSFPELEIQWQPEPFDGDHEIEFYMNTNDYPIEFKATLFDKYKFDGQFKAKEFCLAWKWSPLNTSWAFKKILSGTLSIDCTIDVEIQGNWYQLWPFLLGGSEPPTAIAGGPYHVYPSDPTVTIDASASHDNDQFILNSNGWLIEGIKWSYPDSWESESSWPNKIRDDMTFTLFGNNKQKTLDLSFIYDDEEDDDVPPENNNENDATGDNDGIGALNGPASGPDPQHWSVKAFLVGIEVKDNEGQTAEDWATVWVHWNNGEEEGKPVADAGGPYYVRPGDTSERLDCSDSHDTDDYDVDAAGSKIVKIRWKLPGLVDHTNKVWTLWHDFDNKKLWNKNFAYLIESDDSNNNDNQDNNNNEYENNYNSNNNQYDEDTNDYNDNNNDYYNDFNENTNFYDNYNSDTNDNYDSDSNNYQNEDSSEGNFYDNNQYEGSIGALGSTEPRDHITFYYITVEVEDDEGDRSTATAKLTVYHTSNDGGDDIVPDDDPPHYDSDDSISNYCYETSNSIKQSFVQ